MKKKSTRASFLLLSLLSLKSFANQLIVCNNGCGYTSIASAVADAQSGDTILLKGILTESGITVSKNLCFIGEDMSSTIIQASTTRGNALHRVFYITNGASVTCKDMTVQYGKEGMPDPANANASGGGFLIDGTSTTLKLINVDVKDNDNGNSSGGAGGAIGLYGITTNLAMYNCRIEGNTAPGSAGGLYLTAANGVVDAKNTVFENNYAGGGSGGAVFLGSTIASSYANCSFNSNKANGANSGGAVYANNAAAEFINCTFYNNAATNQGGALRIGPATLINCTFYQNTATNQGGAIYRGGTNSSPLSIVNCTVYGNSGSAGGGLYYNTSVGNINLVNTVLASNTGGDLFTSNAANLSTNQKNYVAASSFGGGSASFDYTSETLNITTPLLSNGGLTQTLAVGPGSVLINNGVASATDVTVQQKDQRNYARLGGVDIGAYETSGSEGVSIAYGPLPNTDLTTNRTLVATVTDGIYGVPVNGAYTPRIYFRKNGGSWASTPGTLVSGSGNNGNWNFTVDNAMMGGVANGDVINYFITAQDNSEGSFAKSNLTGLVAADVLTVSTAPTPESYTINSALPIKLISFDASKSGESDALLTWKVVEDPDADSYQILRSANGTDFKSIATVKAKGLDAYAYTDRNLSGTVYYRLKTLTTGGEVTYSKIVSVNFGSKSSIQLTPNFITTDQASLRVSTPTNGAATYWIVDAGGRQIAKGKMQLSAGANHLALPLSQVGRGQFFLVVSIDQGAPQTLPFIKQ